MHIQWLLKNQMVLDNWADMHDHTNLQPLMLPHKFYNVLYHTNYYLTAKFALLKLKIKILN